MCETHRKYDKDILSGQMSAPQIADKYVISTCAIRRRAVQLGVKLPRSCRITSWHDKASELLAKGKTDASVAMRLGVSRKAVQIMRAKYGIAENRDDS